MAEYRYQLKYSEIQESMYDVEMREQKAKKMLSVLDDHYSGNLETLSLLDIGCSTGIISNVLSERFGSVVGVDIDEQAIGYAKETHPSDNLQFSIQDAMNLGFPDQSFDVAICAHIYEHVPDSHRLLSEIHRVLKARGVCYFAAGNRLVLIEGHYLLPLLSVVPKPLAHLYLRVLRKGNFYYEKLLSLWGLRNLVSQFEIIDYTEEIIRDPRRYCATETVQHGSLSQRMATWILRRAYWLCPTYIWLLRRRG